MKTFVKKKIAEYRKGWSVDEQLEAFLTLALQQAYEEGRLSVLDEFEEEKKKLLQGFSYKKAKNLACSIHGRILIGKDHCVDCLKPTLEQDPYDRGGFQE